MKIKEMEQRTGIPSANIRYYEKEGLLHPVRKENNYREYSEEDLNRLEQIKILRLLGVSLEDIRKIYEGDLTLDSVMAERLEALDNEESQLKEIRRVCENIVGRNMKVEMLHEEILENNNNKAIWKERLAQVLKEDMSKVAVNRTQMNRQITGILSVGFLINAIIAFVTAPLIERTPLTFLDIFGRGYPSEHPKYGMVAMIALVLLVALGIALYFTASVKVYIVIFVLTSVLLSPTLMAVIGAAANNSLKCQICGYFPLFWMFLIIYAVIYCIASERNERLLEHTGIALIYALVMTVVLTGLSYLCIRSWMMPMIILLIATVYLMLFWTDVNRDVRSYTKYYAAKSAIRMINPIAIIFSYYGRSKTPMWGDFTDNKK